MNSEVSPLLPSDHRQVSRLFRQRTYRHLHLDWRTLEQWMPEPEMRAWVLRKPNGSIMAMVGATITHHPNDVLGSPAAWLRFILPTESYSDPLLDSVWEHLTEELRSEGVQQIASLVLQSWTRGVLRRWGFRRENAIITMRRLYGPTPPPPDPPLEVRPGTAEDMPAVVWVDAAAFGPLWAYSPHTLELARRESASFTVLSEHGTVIGYEMSTNHFNSGHLARLAITPGLQGRGYGALLVGEMLRHFDRKRVRLVTVNTQEDNTRSQRLYRRLGFERADQDVPVYVLNTE